METIKINFLHHCLKCNRGFSRKEHLTNHLNKKVSCIPVVNELLNIETATTDINVINELKLLRNEITEMKLLLLNFIKPVNPSIINETVEPVEPVEPVETVKPVEPVETVEPVEPVEPVEIIKPVENIIINVKKTIKVKKPKKIKPIEPIEPIESIEPVKIIEPVDDTTLKQSPMVGVLNLIVPESLKRVA